MFAIGCLLLPVLPLAGLAGGGWIGGPEGAKWGAGIGLGIALVVCGISGYAMAKIGKHR